MNQNVATASSRISQLATLYAVWKEKSIEHLKSNAVVNATKRIAKIVLIVNNKTQCYTTNKFIIDNVSKEQIINAIHQQISEWNGIQIGSCKNEKGAFSEYLLTARNWFDRNKSKIYGNHLFYPLIFQKIYQFALHIEPLSNSSKIILFMDILSAILLSTIKFVQTQSLPLVPLSTFIQPNLFRSSCSNLCRHYDVKWALYERKACKPNASPFKNIRNKARSKNYFEAFLCKLSEIKQKLSINLTADTKLPSFGSPLCPLSAENENLSIRREMMKTTPVISSSNAHNDSQLINIPTNMPPYYAHVQPPTMPLIRVNNNIEKNVGRAYGPQRGQSYNVKLTRYSPIAGAQDIVIGINADGTFNIKITPKSILHYAEPIAEGNAFA